MKKNKLIIIIGSLLLLVSIADTFINATEEPELRTGRRTYRTRRNRRRTRRYRRIRPTSSRSLAVRAQQAQKEQSHPQVAQVAKKTETLTINLKDAVKDVKDAKTSEEKKEAVKTAQQTAQELLNNLKVIERTYRADILGYPQEQIDQARKDLDPLLKQQIKLQEDVNKKQAQLDAVSEKGYFWRIVGTSAKAGNEQEYKKLTEEVASLNTTLQSLNTKINDLKKVAGESWVNAKTALLAAVAVGAVIDYTYGAGVTSTIASAGKTAATSAAGGLSNLASWLKDKISMESAKKAIGAASGAGTITTGLAAATTAYTWYGRYNMAKFIGSYLKNKYNELMADPAPNAQKQQQINTIQQQMGDAQRLKSLVDQRKELEKDPVVNKQKIAEVDKEMDQLMTKLKPIIDQMKK